MKVNGAVGGREIRATETLHVDHAIPFSLWRNNELWNLLPATNRVNAGKRDMIPTPSLIDERIGAIVDHWHLLHEAYPVRLMNEIAVSLIG
ncbi:MAG: HNH endonuclease domain-containing protein [Methanospirillum sp.]